MTPEETIWFVDWLNKLDPRVENNDPSIEAWHRALKPFDLRMAKEITLSYRETTDKKPVVSEIKRLCSAEKQRIKELNEAFAARAIDPHKITLATWKQRHPGRWEDLREEGTRLRDRDLTQRGIPTDPRLITPDLNFIYAPHPRMI